MFCIELLNAVQPGSTRTVDRDKSLHCDGFTTQAVGTSATVCEGTSNNIERSVKDMENPTVLLPTHFSLDITYGIPIYTGALTASPPDHPCFDRVVICDACQL